MDKYEELKEEIRTVLIEAGRRLAEFEPEDDVPAWGFYTASILTFISTFLEEPVSQDTIAVVASLCYGLAELERDAIMSILSEAQVDTDEYKEWLKNS